MALHGVNGLQSTIFLRRQYTLAVPRFACSRQTSLAAHVLRSEVWSPSTSVHDLSRTEVQALVESLLVQDKLRAHVRGGTSFLSYEVHDRHVDSAQWNDLLASTLRWNLVDGALKVFHQIVMKGIRPSPTVVTRLIVFLSERRMFEEGLVVLDKLLRRGYDSHCNISYHC